MLTVCVVCVSTRQQYGLSRPVCICYRMFYKSHSTGQLWLPVSFLRVQSTYLLWHCSHLCTTNSISANEHLHLTVVQYVMRNRCYGSWLVKCTESQTFWHEYHSDTSVVKELLVSMNVHSLFLVGTVIYIYKCKKLQFIHTVNGDGSKTAKIIKRHC